MRAIDEILRALVNLFGELPAFMKFVIGALAEKLSGDYFPYVLAFVVGAIIIWLWQKQSSASTDDNVPPFQHPRTLFLMAIVAAIGIGAFILYQPEPPPKNEHQLKQQKKEHQPEQQRKKITTDNTPIRLTMPQNNSQPTPRRP